MNDAENDPKLIQIGLRGWLELLGVICLLSALILPAIQAVRETGRRDACTGKLKQIGIALYNYHDVYGCFPAPFSVDAQDKPLHSWRVALHDFLEKTGFHTSFDYNLPWNAPKNLKVSLPYTHCFSCPSVGSPADSGFTNYVMVVGQKRVAGSGTKEAIIVVEIADSDIHWTEPRDLNFDEMSFQINDRSKPSISSHHPHGAMVVYADGRVRFLDESTDPDELKKLLTENLEDASGRGRQP